MKKPDRIVLVDSNPSSSADFHAVLQAQPDLKVAASVTCASCSFAAVSGQQPDLVLISLSMPGHRVLELVKDLRVLHAKLKFLIVSSHGLELEAGQALRAGAHGCVLSSSSSATKLDAMRQVLAGHHCFSAETAVRQPTATTTTTTTSLPHYVAATQRCQSRSSGASATKPRASGTETLAIARASTMTMPASSQPTARPMAGPPLRRVCVA